MKSLLFLLSKTIAAGIAQLRITAKRRLSNLYVQNTRVGQDTPLIYTGDSPFIHPQAYGEYLDLLGETFLVRRNAQEGDEEFRRRILFSVKRSATVSGIREIINRIFLTYNINADVELRVSHRDYFDGTTGTFDVPLRNPGGTMLYGISIIVTPRVSMYNEVSMVNFSTLRKTTNAVPPGKSWRVRRNVSVDRFINAYRVPSFRFLLNDMVAAGIKVDRVIIQEGGAGGSKGEVYGY